MVFFFLSFYFTFNIILTLSLLVFNDNFKTSSNCDWNIWTSSRTSSNITWLTISSVGAFFSRRFDWLGTCCTGEMVAEETGTVGFTIDIFEVSTDKH